MDTTKRVTCSQCGAHGARRAYMPSAWVTRSATGDALISAATVPFLPVCVGCSDDMTRACGAWSGWVWVGDTRTRVDVLATSDDGTCFEPATWDATASVVWHAPYPLARP